MVNAEHTIGYIMAESGTKEPPPKRKDTRDERLTPFCIVHIAGIKCGPLRLMSELKDPVERLRKLQEIRDRRLSQPITSAHRMQATCDLIPDQLSTNHGYHQECYKRFTMNLNRLQEIPVASTSSETTAIRPRRRSSAECDKTIFKPDCIFCGSEARKVVKVKGVWSTQGMTTFESDAWKAVVTMAEAKQDEKLLTRIRGYDLFACEAKYHRKCHIDYMQKPEKWLSESSEAIEENAEMQAAHSQAFNCVCGQVEKDILRGNKILKLSNLRSLYIKELAKTPYANDNFRSEKLKTKLQQKYGEMLLFCEMNTAGTYQSQLVYSSAMDVQTAVRESFRLGAIDVIENTGTLLRQSIIDKQEESPELKWPPNPSDLCDPNELLPESLVKLLSHIICGKSYPNTPRMHRLVISIAQDICRASTNGTWKLPKHILMSISLRHLFRSKSLITLLCRLGHCESYSFSLELETALAEAAMKSSSLLSTQICKNPSPDSVFHSEFDNFDQLINDLTGKGSVHTAHGIMIQELGTTDELPSGETESAPRSKRRSLDVIPRPILPDCYVNKKKSPKMTIIHHSLPHAQEAEDDGVKKYFLWIIIRLRHQAQQCVGGWGSFIFSTGTPPKRLTTIDYYPVINQPITEYRTVQECLRYAEEATAEVGQEYTITTFDLGVWMKALPLVWNHPDKYRKHIILIGTFHLACAYMKMIGKKMAGSGLADILLEAGLISGGSISGVLSGKHYERALHCHKVMLETLEMLLMAEFEEEHEQPISKLPESVTTKLESLVRKPSADHVQNVLHDEQMLAVLEKYQEFRRSGKLGKTSQLWISYMDHVRILLSMLEAVKTNNFLLYAQSMSRMTPLFFAFGGHNYARYLSFFSIFLANIDTSHPGALELIKKGAFSVARSFIPGNRCAVDKTMEETFMWHAKSPGGPGSSGAGTSGILTNYEAYQRWVRTTHLRSLYVDAALAMAGMVDDDNSGTCHHDLRPREINKSEEHVKRAMDAVTSFLNPFQLDNKDQLIILSSGGAATDDVTKDVLGADIAGQKARDDFVRDRLEQNRDFFEPVKKMNLKTLEDMNVMRKTKTAKHKVVQYKEQSTVAFRLLLKSQAEGVQINMKELVSYPLTTVPFSLATGIYHA